MFQLTQVRKKILFVFEVKLLQKSGILIIESHMKKYLFIYLYGYNFTLYK